MESILQASHNFFRSYGYVYEKDLTEESCEIHLRNKDGSDNGTTKGNRIRGRVSLKTDNGIVTFDVFAQDTTSENKPNQKYKMYESMLEWNPIIKGATGEDPTLVCIEGSVAVNDYVDQTGVLRNNLRWTVNRASTKVDEGTKTGTSVTLSGMITKMVPEQVQEKETGRLSVEIMCANRQGECFPVTFFVDSDFVDDFESEFNVNDTIDADMDLIVRQIGTKNEKKRSFAARQTSVSLESNLSFTELIIAGGSLVEEPEELTTTDEDGNEVEVRTYYIDPKTMRKAMNERDKKLEQIKKDGPKATTNISKTKKTSIKGVKKSMASKAATPTSSNDFASLDDDDELPF